MACEFVEFYSTNFDVQVTAAADPVVVEWIGNSELLQHAHTLKREPSLNKITYIRVCGHKCFTKMVAAYKTNNGSQRTKSTFCYTKTK